MVQVQQESVTRFSAFVTLGSVKHRLRFDVQVRNLIRMVTSSARRMFRGTDERFARPMGRYKSRIWVCTATAAACTVAEAARPAGRQAQRQAHWKNPLGGGPGDSPCGPGES